MRGITTKRFGAFAASALIATTIAVGSSGVASASSTPAPSYSVTSVSVPTAVPTAVPTTTPTTGGGATTDGYGSGV